MCGIFGYFDRNGSSIDEEMLASMAKSIQHRGPDGHGVYTTHGVALGNQRLSIIDLEGGKQPFVSDDGNIIVVQNGEIYNHIELADELARRGHACRTSSDTEVLLRLYEAEGIDFLPKLNGMFAFAIYDAREQALYLVRDRIGVKPLYVSDDGCRLIFGSEIKAIRRASLNSYPIDYEALHHYLTFNYVPPPYTLYTGIRHLMPGHVLKITRSGTESWRWWNLADVDPIHNISMSDWIAEFNEILNDAVRIRLRCDVPFGAFLSGGVDSSSIVGIMSQHMTEPVHTFCIGFSDIRYDESAFALEASHRFNTNHTMQRVDTDLLSDWPLATYHCDQPHGDISFIPTYRLSQLAAETVKVVLTGDGGDELFAGYDKHSTFFSRPEYEEMSNEKFHQEYFRSISLFSPRDKAELYTAEMKQISRSVDSFDVARPWLESVQHQDRINQVLFLDMQLLLSGNNLVKPDRMGMAVSLEARTPFLDYRMMELAFRIPGSLKLRNQISKYLYKKAVTPLIGTHLAYRKKQMFTVPVGDWFRTVKRDYCIERLNTLLRLDGIIDPSVSLRLLNEHICGIRNNTRQLRALVSLAHWLDT